MWRKDANPKLDVLFTVADVDVGKHDDDTEVQIWKLKFGHKAEFLLRL